MDALQILCVVLTVWMSLLSVFPAQCVIPSGGGPEPCGGGPEPRVGGPEPRAGAPQRNRTLNRKQPCEFCAQDAQIGLV